MKKNITPVLIMFAVSTIIGYNMIMTVEPIQAHPPVVISPIEFPKFNNVKESVEQIEVTFNLETQEVSVTGTTDANVNFKTIGEQKPIVKYITKTKIIEAEKKGHPFVRKMRDVSEQPINPLTTLSNEQGCNQTDD